MLPAIISRLPSTSPSSQLCVSSLCNMMLRASNAVNTMYRLGRLLRSVFSSSTPICYIAAIRKAPTWTCFIETRHFLAPGSCVAVVRVFLPLAVVKNSYSKQYYAQTGRIPMPDGLTVYHTSLSWSDRTMWARTHVADDGGHLHTQSNIIGTFHHHWCELVAREVSSLYNELRQIKNRRKPKQSIIFQHRVSK